MSNSYLEYEYPEPTPEEEAAYYDQLRIDDALYYELGDRAQLALVYYEDQWLANVLADANRQEAV